MNLEAQRAKAELLRRLHEGPDLLVLANPWDAGSARIFEQAGCRALGTTSAGIAFAHGYADGERLSRAEMLEAVRRIVAAVAVPVTADMEAGFGELAADVVETVRGVLRAGAVGVNLEDAPKGAPGTLFEIAAQVEKIRAVRELAAAEGIPLVINARTDVYLDQIGAPESRFDHAVQRANAYRDAGADCLYVPGVRDAETIQRLVQAIRGPLNVLAGPGVPPVAELARLGVRRLSVGSGPMRATLGLTERIARELLDQGTYTGFTEGALPYAEANHRFRR
jgi:2-methylisocitrate lyase-like PEP mutase family enzyme